MLRMFISSWIGEDRGAFANSRSAHLLMRRKRQGVAHLLPHLLVPPLPHGNALWSVQQRVCAHHPLAAAHAAPSTEFCLPARHIGRTECREFRPAQGSSHIALRLLALESLHGRQPIGRHRDTSLCFTNQKIPPGRTPIWELRTGQNSEKQVN